jgi:hypothetical protein
MKRIYLLLMLAAVFAAACTNSSSSPKETFTSEKAKFKIAFPKQPEVHVQNAGAFVSQAFVVQDPQDTAVTYLVNCTTMPRELMDTPDAMDGFLFRTKSNTMAKVEALTAKVDKEVSEYGSRGVYFEADGPNLALAYKVFFIENRMYEVGILAQAGKMPTATTTKAYFDSFEALK